MYDVIIAGGGPAGLQCGRVLSKLGYKICVLERSNIPGEPNYSTAWTPLETIKDFDLPQEIIGDSFSKVTLISPNFKNTWTFDNNAGYILKFNELKKFLAKEIENNGGTVLYGSIVENVKQDSDSSLKNILFSTERERLQLDAKYFIDATAEKGILATKVKLRKERVGFPSVGVEKIIKTHLDESHDNEINIYFGKKFIPHGYAWLSSFGPDQYKVGVCIADLGSFKLVENIEHYFAEFLKLLNINSYEQIEEHGGTIYVSGGSEKNVYKNLIMIGDTGSTINPIVGEGIRHALHSGEIAAKVIDDKEKGKIKTLNEYNNRIKAYRGIRWKLSRLFANVLYHKFNDKAYDLFVKEVSKLTSEELYDFGYNYNFKLIAKCLL